ncbi:hypothetical protein RFI_18204, partial [Reticulomyxa filosa]
MSVKFIESKVCKYFEKAISIRDRLRYLSQYADWLEDLKYYARCKQMCKQAIDIMNEIHGANSPSSANGNEDGQALANGAAAHNRDDDSMPINNKTKYELHSQYARVCEKLHDLESAKQYMKQACELMKFTKPNAIDEYLQTLLNLRVFLF